MDANLLVADVLTVDVLLVLADAVQLQLVAAKLQLLAWVVKRRVAC